ncbi:glycosyltransferase [Candidatus Pelagibacter ubique]|nr:glycosyltransferase [Candidatus Pelagibacter ubique]
MKIAICICFSKKNEIHHHKIINNLNIIKIPKECNLSFYLVVNNNPTKLINLIKKIITNKKINIFILNSVKKDIPNTRNIFLLKIKNKNLDYVGFLDDDCKINRNWVYLMTNFITKYKCDIVGGPQYHKVTNLKYKKLYNILEPPNTNKQNIRWVATNNCFFKKKILDKTNLLFNQYLKNIGGSDQLFFRKLKKKGFSIMWNSKASIEEYLQVDRENYIWFLKRNFRYGYSGLIIDKDIYGEKIGYFMNISKSVLLFFLSLINLFFIFRKYNFIKSLFYFVKGCGRLVSMFGYKINKYQ